MIDDTTELVRLLQENKLMLATAESCTGGKVAAEIVAVTGASDVFFEGLVTYSNESKMRRLGVSENTLKKHGAVSYETAVEMAFGLIGSPVNCAIATTGIAGPGGGTSEKPVGLVYIAVAYERNIVVTENHFSGTREEIREKAKDTAIANALSFIKNELRR